MGVLEADVEICEMNTGGTGMGFWGVGGLGVVVIVGEYGD